MPRSKITVKDLAKICGVSIGTIDRAINDRPGINPDTKKAVLEAAHKYGFVKNQNALMLSSGCSKLIGVIIPDLATEFLTTLITAIEDEASSRGYSTIIMLSRYDPERELDCAKRMRAMNIAGLIVFSVLKDGTYYSELEHVGIPTAAVGNPVDGIPFVGIDDLAAMKKGTEYVLSRGYARLVYIAPLLEKASTQNIKAQSERRRGFELAAADRAEAIVLDTYEKYDRFFKAPSEPSELLADGMKTALICPTDAYTIRFLSYRELGFGILGFDRLPMIGTLIPKLAGVMYPTALIGHAAVSVLLDGTDGDKLFDFEIVPGETV